MSSLDTLWSRSLAAEPKVGRVVDDSPVALRIVHVGTGTTQAPTVVLSSTASTLTLTDGAAAATAIDLSDAAYNTVGEVADYINGLASWRCKILDALRADASNDKFIDGAVTATVVSGETVFDIKCDTSAVAELKYRVTYDRGVTATRPSNGHRVILKKFSYYADLTAAADKIQIYEWNAKDRTETKIWSATSVDTTATEHDLGTGLTPGEGNDLIVVVTGTVVDNAGNFLQAEYIRE